MAASCAGAPQRFSLTTSNGILFFALADDEKASMEHDRKADVRLAATWQGRMKQVVDRELPYDQALRIALECVEVAERYSCPQSQSMSPASADAHLDMVVNLASALECDVRLAVYSLYHGDTLLEHDKAAEQLLNCGKLSELSE